MEKDENDGLEGEEKGRSERFVYSFFFILFFYQCVVLCCVLVKLAPSRKIKYTHALLR